MHKRLLIIKHYCIVSIWLTIVLALCSNALLASHSVGADLQYTCNGNNNYTISLSFYRDCNGIGASPTALVTIRSISCGFSNTLTLYKTSIQQVPAICPAQQNRTTCNGGNLPGIEQHIYSGNITLPANCPDITIGYDICCRNQNITNLASPNIQDMYVEAVLNTSITPCNNSPIFTTLPVPYVCSNQPIFYNHGAVDIDGDQLIYTLVNPLDGPGGNLVYAGNYSVSNPLNTTSGFNFNSSTGQMTFNASPNQNAVVTVLVSEYRNGVLIGSTMRDIQIVVLPCSNNPPTMTGIDGTSVYTTNICVGSQLCFNIFSSDQDIADDVTMTWNNGIPTGTFFVSGGNRPAGTFCWTPTSADIGANIFTVTVKDDACPIIAQEVKAFTVNVIGGSFNASTNATDVTCPGGFNGTASVTTSGTTPPVSYLWSNNATSTNINNISAGTYTVTVTNGNNCSVVETVVVNSPPDFHIDFTTTSAVCNGAADGTALAVVSGGTPGNGYTYNWQVTHPLANTNFLDSLPSGKYPIIITDDLGCQYDTSIFIFQPGPLAIQLNYNSISCFGDANGEISVITTGGTTPYNYLWSLNAQGQITQTIINLDIGTYYVTVTDSNGCNLGDQELISQPDSLIISTSVVSAITCYGSNNGSIMASATGGTTPYSYLWGANANNQNTATANNLTAGSYIVTVTDNHGCQKSANVTLSQPNQLIVNAAPTTNYNGFNIRCFGESSGVAGSQVTGGTPPYSYLWSTNDVSSFAPGVPAGTYTVTVTDSSGCLAIDDTFLIEPTVLTVSTAITSNYNGQDVSCFGASDGEATITISGGIPTYNIDWNDPNNQSTLTAIGLAANLNYVVTIADTNECFVLDSITLTEPPAIDVTATVISNYNGEEISCFGFNDGIAQAAASGGTGVYTYQWDANANNQYTISASNLFAGTYMVTATDANGCTDTVSITLTEPDQISANAIVTSDYNGSQISCFGADDATADVTASGGVSPYTYFWENNSTGISNPNTLGLDDGIHYITVYDINGCEITDSITVIPPDSISLSIFPVDLLCFEDNTGTVEVVAIGGTGNYTYSWGFGGVNVQAISLAADNYYVTVFDANNCSNTIDTIVKQPPLLEIDFNVFDATCYFYADGEATVIATGGTLDYNYKWSEGTESLNLFNVFTGNYSVTVTDNNNCTIDGSVFIDAPPQGEISVSATEDTVIYGGSTQLIAKVVFDPTGPDTDEFEWVFTPYLSCTNCPKPEVIELLKNTTFYVTYWDATGCPIIDSITIYVNPKIKSLYIPNVFTPNGDNINDEFKPFAFGVRKSNLMIFDRWGELVYETNNMDEAWDGTFRGEKQSSGVYVFHLQLVYWDNTFEDKKGSVTLLR